MVFSLERNTQSSQIGQRSPPPLNSNGFANFSNFLGFVHRKVTPYWPQASGEVERFNPYSPSGKKELETKEMNAFLRQYRATPHSTTDISPSEALNGRKLQTLLPQYTQHDQSDAYNSIHERDTENKIKERSRNTPTNDGSLNPAKLI